MDSNSRRIDSTAHPLSSQHVQTFPFSSLKGNWKSGLSGLLPRTFLGKGLIRCDSHPALGSQLGSSAGCAIETSGARVLRDQNQRSCTRLVEA